MDNILMIEGCDAGSIIHYIEDHHVMKKQVHDESVVIMEKLLHAFYHTFESNQYLVYRQHGYYQKVPLLIDFNKYLFFPTHGRKEKLCCWINYYCIEKIKKTADGTQIQFTNHYLMNNGKMSEMILDVDIRVLRKQMQRCKMIHESYAKCHKDLRIYSKM